MTALLWQEIFPFLKHVTVTTDHGFKTLTMRTNIQEPPAGAMSASVRARNLQLATANRQAALQGKCASCHATHEATLRRNIFMLGRPRLPGGTASKTVL